MCWICKRYGDPKYGKGLWYLNPPNYARNMYKLRMPGEPLSGPGVALEGGARGGPRVPQLLEALERGDQQEYINIGEQMNKNLFVGGGGQIVPLADADKVLELCSPIGLMRCMCRWMSRAIDERNELEYTCMGMGVGMLKWERWPERYKGGVKFANIDEAKEWNHEMDRRGFVHLLMLFGAPYIGGFCQCDYPVCNMIRNQVDFGTGIMKSHYVAEVDYDICNSCKICASRCQWGALKFEVTTGKANIDQYKCFGCGLCHTGCPREAIKLVEREGIPALAEVWR